jgi:NADPH:quinone reductase-like Zn-dependent oxidoreductase
MTCDGNAWHDAAVKALTMSGFGGLEEVSVVDLPEPRPGPGEVTLRMRAAALNHLDLWTLGGLPGQDLRFPHVLGADGAGQILEVGEGVSGLRHGTPVIVNPALHCGACEFCRSGEQSLCTTFRMMGEHESGTIAEVVRVPATNVFPFPDHLSFEQAAALGVTTITAYRMLFTRGRLRPGEWVLITGIGGGLALSLFALARPLAGRLFVTSSSRAKRERALEMGADHAIDYKEEDVGRAVRHLTGKRGVDLVVDSAGGSALDAALRALRKGGRLVIAGGTAGRRADLDVARVFWNQLEVIGSTMGSDSDVSDMLRMVAGAGIQPVIDRTFSLDESVDALRHLQTQEQFGKIVITIA